MTTTITSIHSLTAEDRRAEVATMRAELAKGYDRVLELAIEDKEQEIARLDRDHNHYVDRVEKQEADAAASIQRSRVELEQRLMDDYRQSAPGTTEAEAKAALPDLLHRHRLAEQDRDAEHLADAKRRIGPVL